jgi:hypothetical protein
LKFALAIEKNRDYNVFNLGLTGQQFTDEVQQVRVAAGADQLQDEFFQNFNGLHSYDSFTVFLFWGLLMGLYTISGKTSKSKFGN